MDIISANSALQRSRFTGFSLWLRPPEEASVKIFRPLIKEYNEEPFEPHITLLAPIEVRYTSHYVALKRRMYRLCVMMMQHLGEWEIIEKLETLKSSMGSFQVTIKKAAYRDAYFQCVFALCQKSQKLLEAHEKAKNIMFEDQPESAPSSYMPHLSISMHRHLSYAFYSKGVNYMYYCLLDSLWQPY